MSTVSNMHDVVEYDGKNKPLDGQVLLTYTFKKVTESSEAHKTYRLPIGYKPRNSAVSVPKIADADLLARMSDLLPFVQDMIHEARREVLRDVVLTAEGMAAKDLPANWVVSTEQVALDAVIARMLADSASSGGGRFSKAVLADWFMAVAAPILAAGIMSKRGISPDTPEDSPVMLQVLKTLEAVQDALSDVVFSKKRPHNEVLDKLELILNRLSTADASLVTDSTYGMIASKVASWRGTTSADDWMDAL